MICGDRDSESLNLCTASSTHSESLYAVQLDSHKSIHILPLKFYQNYLRFLTETFPVLAPTGGVESVSEMPKNSPL